MITLKPKKVRIVDLGFGKAFKMLENEVWIYGITNYPTEDFPCRDCLSSFFDLHNLMFRRVDQATEVIPCSIDCVEV